MLVQITRLFGNFRLAALALTFAMVASTAAAQWPSTQVNPHNVHGYRPIGPGISHNPWNGNTHISGVGVHRPGSGFYHHVGGGYKQNFQTGNIYNPTTGSYTTGKQLRPQPGHYNNFGIVRHNRTTGSVHIPGAGVLKQSGVYTPIGNGYYKNHSTGNVYNPTTRAYKSRW